MIAAVAVVMQLTKVGRTLYNQHVSVITTFYKGFYTTDLSPKSDRSHPF